jgi:hypothetical protein
MKLIKYEAIGEMLNVERNTEINDIKYYKSKQNEVEYNIERIEETLKNVKDMKSVYCQGKAMIITNKLNDKLKILKNIIPQLEHNISGKSKNIPIVSNKDNTAALINLKQEHANTLKRAYSTI